MIAIPEGGNASYSGTSMVSPHVVSNVCFLVVAMYSIELLYTSLGRHFADILSQRDDLNDPNGMRKFLIKI